MTLKNLIFNHKIFIILIAVLLVSCTSNMQKKLDARYGKPLPPAERMVSSHSDEGQFFLNQVKPIIDSRCAVCHGCYDAPCQLKLTSPNGIDRGSHLQFIYQASRLTEDTPNRLDVDAQTTQQWRDRGFFPALNERESSVAANLQASLIYRLLAQKVEHPLPETDVLPDTFDLSLNRKHSCPKIEEFNRYQKKHPLAGMPYALPNISLQELTILTQWLGNGALMAVDNQPIVALHSQIQQWESLLNQDSLKHQLVARYVYEHWFLASLYFDEVSNSNFFQLVRSSTPPGEPIQIIATRRPFDNPNVERVYYRFMPVTETLLHKTHMPYALNQQRIKRINALFFDDNSYEVAQLPSYDYAIAANPFISFADLPAQARYKFMLDEAQFTIMGFIKGPVCRGNIALNVINDHFWVFFVNPDSPIAQNDEFIASQVDNIHFPAESQSFFENIRYWTNYSKLQSNYLNAKSASLESRFTETPLRLDEQLVWNGDGDNDNAALTVFRHYDSATVLKGLVGQQPQTAWIIDYTLLERIHYLLVAGFDVYGNFSHQLLTRLHMDFLRLEGEFNFLALLPQAERIRLRDLWYRDADEKVKSFIYGSKAYLDFPPGIDYQTENPGLELIGILKQRLGQTLNQQHQLVNNPQVPVSHQQALAPLMAIKGNSASIMPEASFVLVEQENSQYQLYTITSNRAYSNLTSLFAEQKNRLPEEDTLSVIYGVAAAYPSVVFKVPEDRLADFSEQIQALSSEEDYRKLLDLYGIRRTNKQFWQVSDTLHQTFKRQAPISYGLLDYNRLENR